MATSKKNEEEELEEEEEDDDDDDDEKNNDKEKKALVKFSCIVVNQKMNTFRKLPLVILHWHLSFVHIDFSLKSNFSRGNGCQGVVSFMPYRA